MVKLSLISVLLFLLLSCSGNEKPETKEIKIGEYTFQFPLDFKLIKEQGTDSYVGKVTNGKISFEFDYGYYSNKLEKSIPEYFSHEVFKLNALFSSGLMLDDSENYTENTQLLSITTQDSSNYTLTYLYQKDTIRTTTLLPEDIRHSKFEIDTIQNVIYKLVENKEYIGLYVKNPAKFNHSLNSCLALSIIVSKPSKMNKQQIIEILKSCKDLK